jgi:cytochrome c551/c552
MLRVALPSLPNMRRRASADQVRNGAVWCCTTARQNTHVIECREVLYRWHPWFGQSVYTHHEIDKPGDAVFRCNLTGGRSDRFLEVPVWMFDRVACASCHEADTANVGLYALAALADLIRDADCTSFNKSDSSSTTDAALDSEPTIRRSANAAQNDDDATRAIPWDPIQNCDTDPALAEPARRDAASADAIDDTPDDGTCGHGGQGEQP